MEEFGRSARGYVAYLLGATQKLSRFTSDIVKSLGSFDLEILMVDPMEQASYCFKQLFTSFRLRGVVDSSEETVYAEEYLSFVDELRRLHPDMQQPKLLIADAVDFISGQEALKTRRHLNRIFRLSCLCLDKPRFSFSGVRFGSVKTDDPTCSMFDVVAPIQSFLGHGLRGMEIVTSDSSIASSSLLNSPLEPQDSRARTVLGTTLITLDANKLGRVLMSVDAQPQGQSLFGQVLTNRQKYSAYHLANPHPSVMFLRPKRLQ